jgi:hypothetical protein
MKGVLVGGHLNPNLYCYGSPAASLENEGRSKGGFGPAPNTIGVHIFRPSKALGTWGSLVQYCVYTSADLSAEKEQKPYSSVMKHLGLCIVIVKAGHPYLHG